MNWTEFTTFRPGRFYLVYGRDEWAKQETVRKAIQHIPLDTRDFNVDTVEPDNLKSDDVRSKVMSYPFSSDFRLVVLARIDRANARSYPSLMKTISEIPPYTIVLATATEKTDFNTLVHADSTLIEASRLFGKDQDEFIRKTAKELDLKLEKGDVKELSSRCTGDVLDIISLLTKLRLSGGLSIPTVLNELNQEREDTSIFDLLSHIAHRRRSKAFESLTKLLSTGTPELVILKMLTTQLHHLCLIKDGRVDDVPEYQRDRLRSSAGRLNKTTVRNLLLLISLVDRKIKWGEPHAIESLVYSAMR